MTQRILTFLPFYLWNEKSFVLKKKKLEFKNYFCRYLPLFFFISFMGCTILFFLFLWGGHIFCFETKINISLKFKPWITWFAYQPKNFCCCMFLYFWQLIISTLAIHTYLLTNIHNLFEFSKNILDTVGLWLCT